MSRFESNLLEAINSAVSDTKRSILKLAWAAYRVRVGDIATARSVAVDIRLQYSSNYNPQVFAYINFVEGLCEFFENGIESAIPKLKRSNALSNGCPADDELPALIKAWLAGVYRNLGKWQVMADFLISAIASADRLSSEAYCRLSLVAADAFQEIESYDEATRWYASAHHHAVKLGDDAALSAVLYNRAAIRIFNARLGEVGGRQVDIAESRIALEAASAKNYTQYIKDASMQWGFDLMAGQLLILRRDYEGALDLLDSEDVRKLEHQWPAVDLVRRADVLRCRALLGQIDESEVQRQANDIWFRSDTVIGAGDRAISAFSLSMGLASFDEKTSLFFRNLACEALIAFNDERRREAVELDRFINSSETLSKPPRPESSG